MTEQAALLVDGDTIRAAQAQMIAQIAAQHGALRYSRAYLDLNRSSDWQGMGGFRLVPSGSGKNAADILLALEAAELLCAKGIQRFVIATSDGVFRHRALRLREAGALVFGIGESKAPKPCATA
ncbi:MAG: NYN domain-containing protein [Roseinatronobacter sp.]